MYSPWLIYQSFGVVFQGFIPGSDPFRNKQSIGREMYILGDGAK
jgi:hypothetical protein